MHLFFLLLLFATIHGVPLIGRDERLHDTTFHVLGIPFAEINGNFSSCAFTMKVLRMCRMLKTLRLRSVLYANEGSVTQCDEQVVIWSREERQARYQNGMTDAEYRKGAFPDQYFSDDEDYFSRVATAVRQRSKPTDILVVTFGDTHRYIAERLDIVAVESGIGYPGSFAKHRVFESYTWLAHEMTTTIPDEYAVIPNCYYPSEEFTTRRSVLASERPPYLAFVGRLILNKGITVALALLNQLPKWWTLRVAGQGNLTEFLEMPLFAPLRSRVIYEGVLAPAERDVLLANAVALVTPTLYIEPFGGVMVESQLLGTPVISTDHAAMSETIWHGVTGFRCRSLRCYVAAAHAAQNLDRRRIRQYARRNYDCAYIQYQYYDYFLDVVNSESRQGWSTLGDAGGALDQRRFYPQQRRASLDEYE